MFELIITGGNVITHIFIWAYASHLILDMLTIKDIPLLYPFKKIPVLFQAIQNIVFMQVILKLKQ